MISSMEIRFNVVMFNNISKCFTCHANLTFIQIKFGKKSSAQFSWNGVKVVIWLPEKWPKLHIFVPSGQLEPQRSMFSTRKRRRIGCLI